jgi:hypothetical protein
MHESISGRPVRMAGGAIVTWRRWARALPLLLCCLGCADPRLERVRQDSDEYIVGVQYEDAQGLVKRQAPFREAIAASPREEWETVRESHEEQAAARFAAYEEAKVSGQLPLGDDGVVLLQALAVGKGVYYAFEDLHLEEDGARLVARMVVRLDYSPHRFEPFPAGTKLFLLGEPLGTLHTVTVGEALPAPLTLLEEIELEWRLRWYEAEDVYPEGWAVESVRPVPGSARFTSWTPGP